MIHHTECYKFNLGLGNHYMVGAMAMAMNV